MVNNYEPNYRIKGLAAIFPADIIDCEKNCILLI